MGQGEEVLGANGNLFRPQGAISELGESTKTDPQGTQSQMFEFHSILSNW